MSHPSVKKHLKAQGATGMRRPDGFGFPGGVPRGPPARHDPCGRTGRQDKSTRQRARVTVNPNSDEGKQFSRLLGADIARRVFEVHHGVSYGFYNCCQGVAVPTRDALEMTLRERIEAQRPNFVDC